MPAQHGLSAVWPSALLPRGAAHLGANRAQLSHRRDRSMHQCRWSWLTNLRMDHGHGDVGLCAVPVRRSLCRSTWAPSWLLTPLQSAVRVGGTHTMAGSSCPRRRTRVRQAVLACCPDGPSAASRCPRAASGSADSAANRATPSGESGDSPNLTTGRAGMSSVRRQTASASRAASATRMPGAAEGLGSGLGMSGG